jgi:hypothetical protein
MSTVKARNVNISRPGRGPICCNLRGPGYVRLSASFERSIRRALHRMVTEGVLIAIGGGGRADPYRYFFIMCDEPEARALWKRLKLIAVPKKP